MDSVRTNHGVGLRAGAVFENQRHPRFGWLQPNKFTVEIEDVVRHGRGDGCMQVAAMHQQVGRAESFLGVTSHSIFVGELAVVRFPVTRALGLESDAAQMRFQSELTQYFNRVWGLLDARADTRKLARLLVDLDFDPDSPQCRGGGQAADTGPNDRN